jgi:hypothetical protein
MQLATTGALAFVVAKGTPTNCAANAIAEEPTTEIEESPFPATEPSANITHLSLPTLPPSSVIDPSISKPARPVLPASPYTPSSLLQKTRKAPTPNAFSRDMFHTPFSVSWNANKVFPTSTFLATFFPAMLSATVQFSSKATILATPQQKRDTRRHPGSTTVIPTRYRPPSQLAKVAIVLPREFRVLCRIDGNLLGDLLIKLNDMPPDFPTVERDTREPSDDSHHLGAISYTDLDRISCYQNTKYTHKSRSLRRRHLLPLTALRLSLEPIGCPTTGKRGTRDKWLIQDTPLAFSVPSVATARSKVGKHIQVVWEVGESHRRQTRDLRTTRNDEDIPGEHRADKETSNSTSSIGKAVEDTKTFGIAVRVTLEVP